MNYDMCEILQTLLNIVMSMSLSSWHCIELAFLGGCKGQSTV